MLIMGILIACLWPSIQAYGAQQLPVDATVLMIFLSCFGIPGCSIATLVMGLLGDSIGLFKAFIVAPVCLAMLVSCLLVEKQMARAGTCCKVR